MHNAGGQNRRRNGIMRSPLALPSGFLPPCLAPSAPQVATSVSIEFKLVELRDARVPNGRGEWGADFEKGGGKQKPKRHRQNTVKIDAVCTSGIWSTVVGVSFCFLPSACRYRGSVR